MQTRAVVVVVAGCVAAAVLGYLTYAKVSELGDRVTGLDLQLEDTRRELSDAESRAASALAQADDAAGRAARAEARADAAERSVEAAETDREAATVEAQQSRNAALEAHDAAAAARNAEVAARDAELAAREAEVAAREDARIAREQAEAIRRQREVELNRLHEALNTIVETRRTAIGMVLNLGSDRIEFEFDKAELRAEERELLARIAGVLIASADQGFAIQVFGHTDDVGSESYNQTLSERRAAAVREYLVEAGVRDEIISMQGVGKAMPLVDATDAASRARNRRVEIAIIDTLIEFKPARRQ